MPPPSRTPKSKRLILVALAIIAIGAALALISAVRDASIRTAARKLQNPTHATAESLLAAKDTYERNCADCHGAAGDGQGSKARSLWKTPTDFQHSQETKRESDGELYWSITHGSWPMPAFDQRLDDTARWQLVNFLRTFSKARSN
jgi:mono/diheme cytochrome c family protein